MAITPTAQGLMRPGADPTYVTGAQRARELVMRTAAPMAAAQAGPTMSQAQQGQVAASATAASTQDTLNRAAQDVSYLKGRAQQQMTDTGNAARAAQGQAALSLRETQMKQGDALNALDSNAKSQLFDKEMQFQQDQLGRYVMSQAQLQDWAVTQAKSQEDLKNKMQIMEQASRRSIQAMEIGYRKLEQILKDEEAGKIQKLSQQNKLEIQQAASQMKAAYADKQAKAASRQAMWSGIGTLIGTGVGMATPIGPVAGGAIGGGVTSILSGTIPNL